MDTILYIGIGLMALLVLDGVWSCWRGGGDKKSPTPADADNGWWDDDC